MKCGLNEKWLVCRICLKQPKEPMQTIFDRNVEKDLTRMILECGGVPIKQFDHYPDKICNKCNRYLHVAYKFRTTCQRSHKHLSRFIAPVVVDKNEHDTFEEIDTLPESTTIPEETVLLDPSTTETPIVKVESPPTDDDDDDDIVNEEEYMFQVDDDEDDDNEYVEIYEPMTEDEQKQLFEVSYEHLSETETIYQEDVEYLDLEDDLGLPNSDDADYITTNDVNTKSNRMRVTTTKRSTQRQQQQSQQQQASTSDQHGAAKRIKRDAKGKKSKHTSYICDFCGNKYPSQGRLTEHIKLHKGIKPHECEICGHAFAQTQQLARHMNTHTGNRPYKCDYCPAAFADLSTRNKHHRIHTNERPYICDVCGKAFTYTNTLKFHKMIHTGEKPFVCDICGKGFQQAYKLRSHKMVHEKKGIKFEKLERNGNNMIQQQQIQQQQPQEEQQPQEVQQLDYIPVKMESVTEILQL